MSSNLIWRPLIEDGKDLSTALKFALREVYGEPVDRILDESDISTLKGMKAAGLKEAEKLIAAIEKHGRIVVKEIRRPNAVIRNK